MLNNIALLYVAAKPKTPSPEPPQPLPKAVAEISPPSDLHTPPKEVKMEDLSVRNYAHLLKGVKVCFVNLLGR